MLEKDQLTIVLTYIVSVRGAGSLFLKTVLKNSYDFGPYRCNVRANLFCKSL
jgi:hypothetical protein